jgi:hypothetical protein
MKKTGSVHQSEDSVQEQPTEPSSPFLPQLIQQSTAVPIFPQVAMLLLTIQFFRYIMFQEMDPVFFMH